MKKLRIYLVVITLAFPCGIFAQAGPKPVSVGSGSYAEWPPAHEDAERERDRIADTLGKKLFIDESKKGVAVPTNAWWTDLIVSQYAGRLWAHPLCVTADNQGIEIFHPTEWSADGRDMVLDAPIAIRGEVVASQEVLSKDIVIADFEGETYPEGWNTSGDAFGEGPAGGPLEGQSPVEKFAGNRFVNSFHGGDPATGTLESPQFRIERKFLHLLVGGGNLPDEARVDLMVDGGMVLTATGENANRPRVVTWDVSEWKDREAAIHVIDDARGGWGHILLDQIVMSDSPTPSAASVENRFAPVDARAMDWSDWLVRFRMPQSASQFMDVTIGHGLPSVWLEFSGVTPLVEGGSDATYFDATGAPLSNQVTGDAIRIQRAGRFYGVFAPDGTMFSRAGDGVRVQFSGSDTWLVVSALPDDSAFEQFHSTAFAIPRTTTFAWDYDPVKGEVVTNWRITTEQLKGSNPAVVQGWIPHHYRETRQELPFNGLNYQSARGLMKCASGLEFVISYPFSGLLPTLPAPMKSPEFHPARMQDYLSDYAKIAEKREPGKDTYWGGKDLVCLGRNLAMAHELQIFEKPVFQEALRDALVDWFTYREGETEFYFARYPQWRGIIGFNESYGSGNFNDLHFHYGYFTTASALLGMFDPQFIAEYGGMARLVAKQYANWERDDPEFPFLRTFDIWEGHSWAGGFSSGGGNNQESSSEAMQAWGGLFQLGAVMEDNAMVAAGAMGHAMESAATREYWFDSYGQKAQPEVGNFPPQYAHGITGIFFAGGRAFGTYFTADPGWVYGIQWMPVSPSLTYLNRHPEFAKAQLENMWKERAEWIAKENVKRAEKNEAPLENTISSMGSSLGSVVLGFAVQFDPGWVLKQMNSLWSASDPVGMDSKMGGIIYFFAGANLGLGDVRWDWHTSIPTSAVYIDRKTNTTRCVIYNPKATEEVATIYANGTVVGETRVPARTLVTVLEAELRK